MKEKFLLISSLVLFASLEIQAQVQKGDWLLGGSIGINAGNSSSMGYSTSNVNILPHIGLAIGKNSVLGLNFGIIYYNSSSGGFSTLTFATNLFYKKYYVLKNKLGWYLEPGGGAGWSENRQTAIDSTGAIFKIKNTTRYYIFGIVPGIYYQISPGILLNVDCGGISYSYSNLGSGYSSTNFYFNFLNSFTFGLDFALSKNKKM